MDSMSEADLVVVTDTGSTDDTVSRLKARGAVLYSDTILPWRFNTARNISLSHVPEDTDICVCTDLDEVFTPGWRCALENAWTPEATRAIYQYNWSFKNGKPDVRFSYSKIHSRKDYIWSYPVHEVITYTGSRPENTVNINNIELNHYPDPSKSRGSYLPLLELAVAEYPESDRMAYYLGREYMYHGMWEKCIEALKAHLSNKNSTWAEERCASMRHIGYCYRQLCSNDEAFRWYYRAIAEAPHLREPYVDCAYAAYENGNWPLAFCMTQEALKIKICKNDYINMGYAWDETCDMICSIACYWLGMYKLSLLHAKAALEHNPQSSLLAENLKLIEIKAGKSG